MKFTSLIRCVLALAGAFLLGSCGGGGATAVIQDSGPLAVNPATATWYAGVVNTLTISGGSPPFTLSSSEPSLLAVPINLGGRSIDLVPNNPSVIDSGLPPGSLPVRTVNITARSAEGLSATAVIKVGQNFVTGYGISVASTTCTVGSPVVPLCAGGETVLHFDATTNGNILPNRVFRIERIRGPFQFVDPLNSNNQTDVVTPTSDEEGKFTVVVRAAANFPTQVGIVKITDTKTGAYDYRTLTFTGVPATGALTVIPTTITLTGSGPNQCGFGDVDVLVFDGLTPFSATCANPQITVRNVVNSQPGRVTFTVPPSGVCLTGEQCVISDAAGARAVVTFTTVKGAAAANAPLSVVPASITLACGTSGQVTAVGGNSPGNYAVTSTHPRIFAGTNGNSVIITSPGKDALSPPVPPPPGYPTTATVSVTDGATAVPIAVTITGMVGGLCP